MGHRIIQQLSNILSLSRSSGSMLSRVYRSLTPKYLPTKRNRRSYHATPNWHCFFSTRNLSTQLLTVLDIPAEFLVRDSHSF